MDSKRQLSAVVQWHITASCINRCKHCYTYGTDSKEHIPQKDLTFDELLFILEKIRDFEIKYNVKFGVFNITGGDPLMSPNGWKIIEKLRSEGRQVGILGIPERINEETIKKIKELGIAFYQVSLDGMEKTHDSIRGQGSFRRTIKAIEMMEKNDIEYRVMYTIHNLNQNELIPLIEYLQELNVKGNITFDFMIGPTKVSRQDSPRMLSAEEAKRSVIQFHNKGKDIENKGRLRLFYKTPMSNVLNLLDLKYEEGSEILFSGCGIGNHISILSDGTVYPCRRLPISIGNLLEDSFEDIYLNNQLMKQFRRRENWEDCRNCKYFNMCMGCPAVSYAFSGNPLGRMEYCFLKETDNKLYIAKDKIDVLEREELNYLRDKLEEKNIEKRDFTELWNSIKKLHSIRRDKLK